MWRVVLLLYTHKASRNTNVLIHCELALRSQTSTWRAFKDLQHALQHRRCCLALLLVFDCQAFCCGMTILHSLPELLCEAVRVIQFRRR